MNTRQKSYSKEGPKSSYMTDVSNSPVDKTSVKKSAKASASTAAVGPSDKPSGVSQRRGSTSAVPAVAKSEKSKKSTSMVTSKSAESDEKSRDVPVKADSSSSRRTKRAVVVLQRYRSTVDQKPASPEETVTSKNDEASSKSTDRKRLQIVQNEEATAVGQQIDNGTQHRKPKKISLQQEETPLGSPAKRAHNQMDVHAEVPESPGTNAASKLRRLTITPPERKKAVAVAQQGRADEDKPNVSTGHKSSITHISSATNADNVRIERDQNKAKASKNNTNGNAVVELSYEFQQIAQHVLNEEYINVSKRMNVPHQPLCLNNIKGCIDHHKRKFAINLMPEHKVGQLNTLLRSDNQQVFLRVISNMPVAKEFPNATVLQMLLEDILTINDPSHDEYETSTVISMATMAFAKILEVFPPCCAPCKSTYRHLVCNPIGMDTKLPPGKFNENISLLSNILKILPLIIVEGQIANGNVSLNETEDFANFFEYWAKNNQEYSFDKLSRQEKVERVFLVLNLLLQLMEADMMMWIFTYGNDPRRFLVDKQKYPLIVSYLWPNETPGENDHQVKTIVGLFVDYVSINFAHHKIGYLSRLINLIFTAIYQCEYNDSDDLCYPNIGNRCKAFADVLNQTIEMNQAYSTKLYVNVIKHLRTPMLKWLLCNKFLSKINNKPMELRPRTIHALIIDGDYLKVNGDQPSMAAFDDPLNESQNVSFSQHYPCMESAKRRKTSVLSDKEFVFVLQSSFEAYANIYHLPEIIAARHKEPMVDMAAMEREYAAEVVEHNEMAKQSVDYDALAAELETNPDAFLDEMHNCPIFPIDIANQSYRELLMESIDIELKSEDLRRYRDDIKYYEVVKEMVGKAENDYFDDWFKQIPKY